MGIDFPSSLTASTGQKFTYSGQEYEFNGTAWRKVRDKVTSFNGATGAIIGVTSVQGKTGDVTLTDLEITHGVETFNGLSGSIDTTSLVLPVTGISASGGITASGGLANISSTNKFRVGVPGTGFGDGPFTPNTYSFPTSVGLATSASNPSILVNRNAIALFSGDRALEWANLGEFCVNSFNGVTGDVDTSSLTLQIAGVTLGAGGITFSDGTQLTSEGQIAFKNEANTFTDNQFITVGKGIGANGLDLGIRFDANQVVVIGDPEDSTNSVKLTVDDNNAVVKVENANFDIPTSIRHLGDADTKIQFGTDTVDIKAGNSSNLSLDSAKTKSGVLFNAAAGISMDTAGITFPDGTFQDTAARAGLKYTVTSSPNPSAGEIYLGIDLSGIFDYLVLHDTDAHGNDISGILSLFADNGGYIQVLKDDGSALIGVAIDATETSNGTFGSDKLTIQQVLVDFEIEEQVPSAGDTVYIDINPSLVSAVQSIGGSNTWNKNFMQLANGLTAHNLLNLGVGYLQVEESAIDFTGISPNVTVAGITFSDNTLQKTAPKGVGTFTVSASSAISTGAKTDALHRIPYNATLTKFELKSKATGGMTAAVYIAGGDFGNPTSGFVTGATAEITGLTGETTTFGTASVNEGDFIYLHVLANASGATAAQAFVSYETRA